MLSSLMCTSVQWSLLWVLLVFCCCSQWPWALEGASALIFNWMILHLCPADSAAKAQTLFLLDCSVNISDSVHPSFQQKLVLLSKALGLWSVVLYVACAQRKECLVPESPALSLTSPWLPHPLVILTLHFFCCFSGLAFKVSTQALPEHLGKSSSLPSPSAPLSDTMTHSLWSPELFSQLIRSYQTLVSSLWSVNNPSYLQSIALT